MRILHILDHSIPLQSGYTFRTRNILREQRKLGWETCHVTGLKQRDVSELEEEVDGLHFYRTADGGSLLGKLPLFNQLHVIGTLERRIGEVIEREKPDILHAHSPALNGLAALRAGKKYGLPVVYECRAFWEDAAVDHGTSREWGARYRVTRALESYVFKKVDAITTICEGLRSEIIARGIPRAKVTVIPNAVNLTDFDFLRSAKTDLVESLGLADKIVLGFIGSFYAYEGIPFLLEALLVIKKHYENVVLLLVGGGPDESKIRGRISDYGLHKSVILTGRVPHDAVHDYYDLMDVLVYPRLSMRLTDLVTPLKPLEAMAQKRLVVASNVGGHLELIQDGVTGRLFEAGDKFDLARVLTELFEHSEKSQSYRERGRCYVEQERNWEKSVGNYADVYAGLGRA